MQYSEPAEIQTRPQSRNEIYGHMEHLVQKHKFWSITKNKENKGTRKKS